MIRIRSGHVIFGLALAMLGSPLMGQDGARPDDAALIEEINSLATKALAQPGGVGLSVSVARIGEIILAKGYGLAEVEHDVAADTDTTFRIGSVTKQFTAAAIMRLVELGKLSLDDELTKYFPDYPMQGHTVTLRHLLSHTSGIKNYTDVPEFWDTGVARELPVDEMLAFVKDVPFDFAPGARYAYNNTAYYMLGPIIEQASGLPYCDFLKDTFFTPMNLPRTRCDSNVDIIPNRAQGYDYQDGVLTNDGLIGMGNPGAAGMITASARDLLMWNMALMSNEVVSAISLSQMTTPYTLDNGEATAYGFGFGIGEFEGHRKISHDGGIFGFNSMLAYFPEDDLYVAVISNSGAVNSGRVANDIVRAALGIVSNVADLHPTPEDIERVSGQFAFKSLPLEARIFEQEGFLYVLVTDQPEMKLLYQGNGEFRASFDTDIKIVFDIATCEGPCPSFILHQGGQQILAERKEED